MKIKLKIYNYTKKVIIDYKSIYIINIDNQKYKILYIGNALFIFYN